MQALDIKLLSLEGVIIIVLTGWFVISTLEKSIVSEASALKSDVLSEIKEHIDERLDKTIELLEEKFSTMIDPTIERVGDLTWMYKKDHPRGRDEDETADS